MREGKITEYRTRAVTRTSGSTMKRCGRLPRAHPTYRDGQIDIQRAEPRGGVGQPFWVMESDSGHLPFYFVLEVELLGLYGPFHFGEMGLHLFVRCGAHIVIYMTPAGGSVNPLHAGFGRQSQAMALWAGEGRRGDNGSMHRVWRFGPTAR